MSEAQKLSVEEQPMTADRLIENYVKLRDKKREMEDAHKLKMEPVNNMLFQLEGYMLEMLNRAGLDSMKGAHGTAYKSTRRSATVTDWTQALPYIVQRALWHLFEARVSKVAAFDYVKETKEPIPGVELSSEICVNVRRAGERAPTKDKE